MAGDNKMELDFGMAEILGALTGDNREISEF
jgi:hypothetical protein